MTAPSLSDRAYKIAATAPVIPVIVIDDVAHAEPMAEALVANGLPVLEVTLRTDAAFEAIRTMAKVSGAIVGAGTVLTAADAEKARAAGASFAVAPGTTPAILKAAGGLDLPIIPGAITASEVMTCLDLGYDMLKFFPAEPSGGIKALSSLAGPLPQARFCPTGGVGPANAKEYLALKNVVCVGGSWVVDPKLVAKKDWSEIGRRAAEAAVLKA